MGDRPDAWTRLREVVAWNVREAQRSRGRGVTGGMRYLKRWVRGETEPPPSDQRRMKRPWRELN